MEPTTDRVLEVMPAGPPVSSAHGARDDLSPAEFALWWTPLLGPAAAALHHALGLLGAGNTSTPIGVDVLGSAFGLSARRARLVVPAALDRLEKHGLCFVAGDAVFVKAAGPLPAHLRRRVPSRWLTAAVAAGEAAVASSGDDRGTCP